MLSYEQVLHFNTFGFLKVPQLFTPNQVADIVRESSELRLNLKNRGSASSRNG